MSALTATGKPMRALRTIRDSTAANPLTEYDVYRANAGASSGWIQQTWHGALATLVKRGFAERCGTRGLGQWFITEAGRDLLDSTDEASA